MAKYSYYAIEAGGQKKIFRTWPECQSFRDKFPSNARYKGFASEADAVAFLNAADTTLSSPAPVLSHMGVEADPGTAIAYTDGSYNQSTGEWGYGFVLFPSTNEPEVHESSGKGDWCADTRNIAGEVRAAVYAAEAAAALGFRHIVIFHDYEGVEAWATGRWKTNKEVSQWYKRAMDALAKNIDITFRKVTGHSGVRYNERADILAKSAVGLS